jgi:gas vesicle protein
MGEDPDRIRREIELTRAEMGETVDALGYKADVKTRTKEKVVGVKDRIAGAAPDGSDVKRQARQAKSVAQENPLGLAVGAVAVGFLAGMLIPATRIEDERLGPVADDVKERAKETGQEALERGKQVAQDAAETASDSAREHGEQLRDTAQEHAQQAMR